jgi:hypothetical protein
VTGTSDNPFIGAWRLISCEAVRRNGKAVPLYGPAPMGRLYYDADGNMSVHIMRRHRAPLRSNGNRTEGADEMRAAFEGYQAYFSTYVVEAERHLIHHNVIGSLFPNWTGTTQTRSYTFEGSNRLVLSSPPSSDGRSAKTLVKLVWERLPRQGSVVVDGDKVAAQAKRRSDLHRP